ncbi:hypothetical protein EYF80_007144 [Liparis tanakae]|uniref:Uncharacterized protein n=1 Tax=Liparis tanakae TaxID=230148 RepID=A0A4Z2IXL8_9TELE|nr:hypothetical protein EYF80_007144 [Liparis tanakae]
MLHFTLQPPLPFPLSHSPAKTSPAREACLETRAGGSGVGTSASLRLAPLPSNRHQRLSFLHLEPVRSTSTVATLPSRKSTAQGQGEGRARCDGIGSDGPEQNEILVTRLPHHVSAGLTLVINNLLNGTSALVVDAADELVIVLLVMDTGRRKA